MSRTSQSQNKSGISILTLRSLLLRLFTKLPFRQPLQPPLLPLNLANLEIILPRLTLEHPTPPLNGIMHPLPRQPSLPLLSLLQLRLCNSLSSPYSLQFSILVDIVVDGDVGKLCTTGIWRQVFLEATGYKRTGCVAAGEEIVTAAGAVDVAAGGDVVDCAV